MGQKTDDTNANQPIEGSVFGAGHNNDSSFFDGISKLDISQEFNFQVQAPKCKEGIVPFMKNFAETVICLIDDFLAYILIPEVDPFAELSFVLGSTMERLYQLRSFIDGYS